MALARNYFAWQCDLVKPELGRRVLEVGCGIGNFTAKLLDREAVIATDVEADCVARLKQRYLGRTNLYAYSCGVTTPGFTDLAKHQPDSCVCLNVLEHIQDDEGALREMASVIVPDGVIVLIVPAFESLYGPIDRLLGHYRRYRRKSFETLAKACGLRVVKARYMNVIGFFGWWANSRVFHRTEQSAAQIEFFDRHLVPLQARLEQLVHPPFGQSLLFVLRKG